ncbi:MAG: hypothetical protein QOH87_1507 [Trebonia sp.]|jgi:hypothetical protein|nr:hypothetical protein [Trebonia sp.]
MQCPVRLNDEDRFNRLASIFRDGDVVFAYPGIAQPVIDAYQIGNSPTAGP